MENEEVNQYMMLQSKILERCNIILKLVIDRDLKFSERKNNYWQVENFLIIKDRISIIIDEFPNGYNVQTLDLDMDMFISEDYTNKMCAKIEASNDRFLKRQDAKKEEKSVFTGKKLFKTKLNS